MKKAYIAPSLEVEQYQLDANIAKNCAVVVDMGDYGGGPGQPACDSYFDIVNPQPDPGKAGMFAYNVDFWEQTCYCYVTAGGEGFFTS